MPDQNDINVAKQLGTLIAQGEAMKIALTGHAKDSRDSRGKMYDALGRIDTDIALLKKSVSGLDKQMRTAQETISDFENIKAQAKGAGRAMWALWIIGGGTVLAAGAWLGKIVLAKFGL